MEHLRTVFLAVGHWTYVLVGLDIILESSAFLGLVLPGDSVVILMGVLAGGHIFALWPSAILVVLCAFTGDTIGYFLGRYKGQEILSRVRWFRRQYEERHETVERHAQRFGAGIILIGRFLPFIRAVTPFTMGLAGMDPIRLLISALLTSIIWAGGFFTVGVVFGHNFKLLDSILAPVGGGIFGLIVFGMLGWAAWKYRDDLKDLFSRIKLWCKARLLGSV